MSAPNAVVFVAVLSVIMSMEQPAYAYLNPGTGSVILQVLLGGLVGMVVVIKLYWSRLKPRFFRRAAKRTESESDVRTP